MRTIGPSLSGWVIMARYHDVPASSVDGSLMAAVQRLIAPLRKPVRADIERRISPQLGILDQLKEWIMAQKHSNPGGAEEAGPDTASGEDSDSQRLEESIAEAKLLIWYASREGIAAMRPETVQVIFDTEAKHSTNELNSVEEAEFWRNYSELSKAIAPVSVDSIKASYGLGRYYKTSAQAAIRKYSFSTLLTLLIILTLQAYWFVGTNTISHLQAITQEEDQYLRDQIDKNNELTRLEHQKIRTTDLQQSKRKELKTLKEENNNNNADQINKLEQEISTLEEQQVDIILQEQKTSFELRKLQEIVQNNTFDRQIDFEFLQKLQSLDFSNDDKLIAKSSQDTDALLEKGRVRINSKTVLAILNQYILPLLYGLLGSLAYILRTLTTEIRQVTYTRGSNVRYRLRWPLGMLAGVTIGWFFDTKTLLESANLTPLALAFLAGYSVELLFTGLDRVVGAFTEQQGQAKAQVGT